MKKVFLILAVGTYAALKLTTDFTDYENLSIALFVYLLLSFIDDLGKKLVILDIIILSAIFSCLLLPISGYHYFNANNPLAALWIRFMQVTSTDYYGFMFPATLALILGLKLPIFFRRQVYGDHIQYMVNAKRYIRSQNMKWQGIVLIGIGLMSSLVKPFVGAGLNHFFFLLTYLVFVGVFYCLYTELPNKRLIVISVFGILLLQSVILGMFGELIFMGTMAAILMLLGSRVSLRKKIAFFLAGISLILVIQVVKPAYRKQVWSGKAESSELLVFYEILSENISSPSKLFKDEKVWFNFYSRFNQGQVISLVLKRVPARIPHANGETIYLSLASVVVPRILWPDKIESGGVYNFKRFLGLTLEGYSVGLSPYGEAWGNYGRTGGIVFMFFFGLLFNLIFNLILKIALKTPSLILWLPIMFFYSVKIESDLFSMLNSLTKAAIFTFLMYKLFPLIFRMKI